ncbi:HAD-IIIA family hydrolase [Alkaliphilus peptidifermentans]|uniref:Phosphoglycolate phosphatase n=1 Tax=Alkaliphilus peptidifermentans DSM 18978 TaxID=1120976 RepID=A0A1G5D7N2_9FIRM|nr:HAD-IIIA family hydrolase [Alkaliphilus peptidifermentans]SCY10636.1 phosphoglycolate phosphatase [Alkaliphilus peptidifermentans DSM 18978]
MIKYIIFDFDGTLVDSMEIGITAINKLAEKYKFKKLKHEEVEHLRGLSIPEISKYVNFPIYKIPIVAVEFYSLYKNLMKDLVLFDDMKESLEKLKKKGYELAIISSNSENNIREFLRNQGVRGIREVICSSNIFGKDKMIKRFLKEYKLKKSEVIYVGDEHRDIVACKATGIKIIWVSWGFDTIDIVKDMKPDYIINSPKEIFDIV